MGVRMKHLVTFTLAAAMAASLWPGRMARADDLTAVDNAASRAADNEVSAATADTHQEMLELRVRVVDADGEPVAGAKVTPWALRSSQGHGWWKKGDVSAGVGPQDVVTDANGLATVKYPKYRSLVEWTKTISVSVMVDHPDFVYVNAEHVDVPLETQGSHEIRLTRGVPVEVRPLVDGRPAAIDGLHAFWSDGRAWIPGAGPVVTPEGTLRFPAMAPGKNSLLLVRLDGQRASAFSRVIHFDLTDGLPKTLDVAIEPCVRIRGRVSDNVPRPILRGHVKTESLPLPADEAGKDQVSWWSWSPIAADGTFEIDHWPAGERIQVVGLCDGFVAASGRAPDVVRNPRNPDKDPYRRPQVFAADPVGEQTLDMTPMARCEVTAVDEDDAPVAGVTVVSGPNVGWWNRGSGFYAWPPVLAERSLLDRVYDVEADGGMAEPFRGVTDAEGKVVLALPAGQEGLWLWSEVYELPVNLGSRHVEVELVGDETTFVTLHLQARGTEKLGDWDKLAGVVFGCSTREGRRILALPGMSRKMDVFLERFLDGQSRRDPKLLAEAYSLVADAFSDVGDTLEAARWRNKSEVEAKRVKTAGGERP